MVLIVALWCFAALPSLIDQVQGREVIDVTQSRSLTGLAAYAQVASIGLVLLVCAHIIISKAVRPVPRASGWLVVLLLLPWGAAQIATAFSSSDFGISTIYFPFVLFALWLANPPLEVIRTIGWLTVLTAGVSLVLMVIAPLIVTIPQSAGEYAKALVGDRLLAGPYGHPNTLGVAMALGFPAILYIRKSRTRVIGYAATFAALLLTASRTSLLAVVLGVAVVLLVAVGRGQNVRSQLARVLAYGLASAALIAVVVIPLTTVAPESWSNRGRIWITSLQYFAVSPVAGNGPDFYGQVAHFMTDFNRLAFHGHNMFINVSTTTGWLGLSAFGLVIAAVLRSSVRAAARGNCFPLMFTAAFAGVSLLEVVTDFRNFGSFAYCAWIPIVLVVFSGRNLQAQVSEAQLPVEGSS
ncbi:O-antigen ligase [Okibacterium sp. HSC-33S16]|uniref:O-antigen ligase family protein n=1 Tax=Okibacterium sp. HSC-33S16 TaxID=2910965 RepID=UPI00209CD77E|nr:O-antigen ligase family protein [Okibacterium sp. HSC-33S16]MCP2032145.1 O-antigen ligase [Okibacterium sp. HSC-33S16]